MIKCPKCGFDQIMGEVAYKNRKGSYCIEINRSMKLDPNFFSYGITEYRCLFCSYKWNVDSK